MNTSGPLENYSKKLDDLGTHPDKQKINGLTMTARDVSAGFVSGLSPSKVIDLIYKKVLYVPTMKKVPLLYVLDSILFNVKGTYLRIVESRLPQIFQVRLFLMTGAADQISVVLCCAVHHGLCNFLFCLSWFVM